MSKDHSYINYLYLYFMAKSYGGSLTLQTIAKVVRPRGGSKSAITCDAKLSMLR